MWDKAYNFLYGVQKRIIKKVNGMTHPIRYVVFGYGFVVQLLVLTYYIVWILMWLEGKEGLTSLLSLLREMTSPALIGFITFIALSLVDSDNDGIPDSMDKVNDKAEAPKTMDRFKND